MLDLEGVLIDIADKALPPLTAGLKHLDEDFNALVSIVKAIDGAVPDWAKKAVGNSLSHAINPLGSAVQGAKDIYHWMMPPSSVSPGPSTTTTPSETKPEKQSYNIIPSKENPKPITLAASLNIDGTQLAQTIASKLADIYENSPNAPTSNDASYYDSNGGIAAS
jgi:hypothetical protein